MPEIFDTSRPALQGHHWYRRRLINYLGLPVSDPQ